MMGPCRLSNNEILSKYHSNCSSLPDKYTSVQVAIWQDLVDEIVILHYLNFCETPNKTFTSPITPPTTVSIGVSVGESGLGGVNLDLGTRIL